MLNQFEPLLHNSAFQIERPQTSAQPQEHDTSWAYEDTDSVRFPDRPHTSSGHQVQREDTSTQTRENRPQTTAALFQASALGKSPTSREEPKTSKNVSKTTLALFQASTMNQAQSPREQQNTRTEPKIPASLVQALTLTKPTLSRSPTPREEPEFASQSWNQTNESDDVQELNAYEDIDEEEEVEMEDEDFYNKMKRREEYMKRRLLLSAAEEEEAEEMEGRSITPEDPVTPTLEAPVTPTTPETPITPKPLMPVGKLPPIQLPHKGKKKKEEKRVTTHIEMMKSEEGENEYEDVMEMMRVDEGTFAITEERLEGSNSMEEKKVKKRRPKRDLSHVDEMFE